MARRKKVSTTISQEGYKVIRRIIRSGRATTVAQALDLILEETRRAENRERLERQMAAYYEGVSPEATAEENEIAEAFSRSAHEINLDE